MRTSATAFVKSDQLAVVSKALLQDDRASCKIAQASALQGEEEEHEEDEWPILTRGNFRVMTISRAICTAASPLCRQQIFFQP